VLTEVQLEKLKAIKDHLKDNMGQRLKDCLVKLDARVICWKKSALQTFHTVNLVAG